VISLLWLLRTWLIVPRCSVCDTPAPGELGDLGGYGSAGDDPNGGDGDYEDDNRALAGGGGAGRIRINTADGTVAMSGTLSPSESSGCATIGTLGE